MSTRNRGLGWGNNFHYYLKGTHVVVVELSIFTIGRPIGIDSLRRKDLRLLPLGQDWILFVQVSW